MLNLQRFTYGLLFLSALAPLFGQAPALVANFAGGAVPPGGTAELVLTLNSPLPIAHGRVTIDLDPVIFGNISVVNVFSATGDQIGVASIQGRHADVEFTSSTGGIGRLPKQPILQVSAPVLSTTNPGTFSNPSLGSPSPWQDSAGNVYSPQFVVSPVAIGGTVSIQNVVQSGTAVIVNGSGFLPSGSLEIEGVAWQNLQFISSTQIGFTLAEPTDLTGRLVRIVNPDRSSASYYVGPNGQATLLSFYGLSGLQPIVPSTVYTSAGLAGPGTYAFESPTGDAVQVVSQVAYTPMCSSYDFSQTIFVEPGKFNLYTPLAGPQTCFSNIIPTNPSFSFQSSAPIRAIELTPSQSPDHPGAIASGVHGRGINEPLPGTSVTTLSASAYSPLILNLQKGMLPPAPQNLKVGVSYLIGTAIPASVTYAVSAVTDDGNPWLVVAPAKEQTCTNGECPGLMVSVDLASLSPGVHRGTINVISTTPGVGSSHTPVTLVVSNLPFISAPSAPSVLFLSAPGQLSTTINIASSGAPVPIVASAAATDGSSPWFSVTPTGASAPASLTVTATIPQPAIGQPAELNGMLTVQGPSNRLTFPVYLDLSAARLIDTTPFAFSLPAGSVIKSVQTLTLLSLLQPFTFSSSTATGGPWLSASFDQGSSTLSVTADPTGLAAGVYQGIITITTNASLPNSTSPVSIPVQLVVYSGPAPSVSASATNIIFTAPFGSQSFTLDSQIVTLSTGSLPFSFDFTYGTDDGSKWLGVRGPDTLGSSVTPSALSILAVPGPLAPGVYHGHIIVRAPAGSANQVTIAVTLNVTPSIPIGGLPLLASLVNAASMLPGPLAPGEIVTLFGANFGTMDPTGVNVGADGRVNASALGTRVLFNGTPAPLLYSSPTQINAVVPYEVQSSPFVSVQVDANGTLSPQVGVPLSSSAPGIFAVLNQDGTAGHGGEPSACRLHYPDLCHRRRPNHHPRIDRLSDWQRNEDADSAGQRNHRWRCSQCDFSYERSRRRVGLVSDQCADSGYSRLGTDAVSNQYRIGRQLVSHALCQVKL